MIYHQTADVDVTLTEVADVIWIVDAVSAIAVVSGSFCFSSAAAVSDATTTGDAAITAVSGSFYSLSSAAASDATMTADAVAAVVASYDKCRDILWYPCVLLYSFS